MSIGDFFGTGEQTSQQTSSIPPYLEAFYRDKMMPRLEGMLDRPPPVYPGQRNAGFTPEEERAFGFAEANIDNPEWSPYFGRANQMTEAGAQAYNPAMLGPEGQYDPSLIGETASLTPEAVSRYMDPFQDQVIDSTIERLNRQNDRNALRDRGRATRTGNLYSAGHGIVDAERDAATDREVADTTGRLLSSGYDRAVSQFNTDTNRQLQARTADVGAKNRAVEFLMSQGLTREQANQAAANRGSEFNRTQALAGAREMASQGTQRQTLRNQDYSALQNAGAAKRGMNQTNLNTAYEDFLKQYEYPLQNLSQVSQIAAGQPYSRTQTTTTPGQSPFNVALGAGLVGKSIFGFKDGGMVEGIDGPRGPSGPTLARQKRRATMTPGRQKEALPPPMLNARRTGRNAYAA